MLMNRWLEGIGPSPAGQPVRDRGRRPPAGQFIASGLDRPLGHGDRQRRPLPPGESAPAHSRNVVVPPRQTDHNAIDTDSTHSSAEVGLLNNQADYARHAAEGQLADVVSIEKYRTLIDVARPRDEVGERRFAGSRLTDDRGPSRRHTDVHVPQRPITVEPITVVPERHARHPHFASHRI